MGTRTIYYLTALTVIATMGISLWMTVHFDLGMYVIAVEVLTIVAIFMLVALYNKSIRPLRTIVQGLDLLRTQDFNSRLLRVNHSEADVIIDLFNRLFEQLKNERMVAREVNNILEAFVNSSIMGMVIMDVDEHVSLINPSANRLLGYSEKSREAIGLGLDKIDNGMAKELSQMVLSSTKIVYNSDGNIYKCSKAYFVESGYNYTFFLMESITEELLQAERGSYEKVIRMISHEVNNSMAGISSSIDSVRASLEEVSGVDPDVEQVLAISSDRCMNLSQFISRFAEVVKIPEPSKIKISIDEFIENCSRILQSLAIDKDIDFTFKYNGHDMNILVDVVLMEQAMLNIVKNAVEATSDGGFISIETSCYPSQIVVSNNGAPIPDDSQQKLFTPFYSTKINGQGIGLMLVKDILTKHRYKFELKTHKDSITRFTITLPPAY
ncbi:MAG: ATP-binding protein [Rikenellaceae bacterium]